MEGGGVHLFDDLGDPSNGLGSIFEIAAEDFGSKGDDDGLSVFGLVVAVGVAVPLDVFEAEGLAEAFFVDFGRRLAVVEEGAGGFIDLVFKAGVYVVAELFELLCVGEEPGSGS
ncbi:MAG: hypothetical protein HUU21_23530 [Polyangiaceae bacterium]|nr:hypothetical protein [Polyangiaceae bacterium]